MPYKQTIPCGSCQAPRTRGGRKDANNLCWKCWVKAGKPKYPRITAGQPAAKKKGKPMPHQQHQGERATDKARRVPPSSWWQGTTREQFNANLAAQRDRLQAGGCGVEKSQRPIGAE